MESAQELKIAEIKNAERLTELEQWLRAKCALQVDALQPMHGDASFRRYFRIHAHGNSFVVMDAPPPQENCRSYVAVANALRSIGLKTPEIIHADLAQGFLVVTDFGDATYLKTLNTDNADRLYQRALRALALLQGCRSVAGHIVPVFTADFMWKEWAWHKEWVLEKMLGLAPPVAEDDLDQCYQFIVRSAVEQPQVFMHRDYHSANLMVLEEDSVGILDFQDALWGPVTYDLVSLLRDCYIDWPQELVKQWVLQYHQLALTANLLAVDNPQQFLRWFDWIGLQRHLKCLGIFSRLYLLYGKPNYLQYIPRTLHYARNICHQYREFNQLGQLL